MSEETCKLEPLYNRVLVRRIDEQESVNGGIIVPDAAKEKPLEGEVIKIGPGKDRPLSVGIHDRVLFGKYAGVEIKLDGKEFLIMAEEEILGIIRE